MDRISIDERLADQRQRAWFRSFRSQVSAVAEDPSSVRIGIRRRNAIYVILLLFTFLFISAFLASTLVSGFEPNYTSEFIQQVTSAPNNGDSKCFSKDFVNIFSGIERTQPEDALKSCSPDGT